MRQHASRPSIIRPCTCFAFRHSSLIGLLAPIPTVRAAVLAAHIQPTCSILTHCRDRSLHAVVFAGVRFAVDHLDGHKVIVSSKPGEVIGHEAVKQVS